MIVVVMGIVLGVALSIAGTRLIASLIFGITPTNALSFALAALLLTLVALVACLIPARRPTNVDPLEALRYE